MRIPGLNMEALWLSYAGKRSDLITALGRFKFNHIDTQKVHEEKDFLEALKSEAAQWKEMDDTVGA